jgi:hypothetical protein
MRKYVKISVFVLAGLFMASCNQSKLEFQEERIVALEQENEALRQQALEKEATVNDFFESMAKIRENLNEIKVRQNLISEETKDKENIGQDVRSQIESDLAAINNLMEDNRKRLANLNNQLRNSNVKITEFESLVAGLNDEIGIRNQEISQLRDDMNNLNISNEQLAATIDELKMESTERLSVIEEKTEQLNTAWYVFGTRKELRDQEIIDRRGGLLGLGRTTVVNKNVNREYFTRLDISNIEKVFIPGKNASLLSLHPEGSYTVESNGDNTSMIFIEDPEKFWSNTRYLIVSVE